jgi:hypothetical protein
MSHRLHEAVAQMSYAACNRVQSEDLVSHTSPMVKFKHPIMPSVAERQPAGE